MKTLFLKFSSASIAGLLAVLGFMACVNSGCMKYGCPSADTKFRINGNVSSKETQQPVENISVHGECSSSRTNEVGNYQVKTSSHAYLHFYDPVGNYQDFDTLIEFQKKETSKTVNVQLTPKNSTP